MPDAPEASPEPSDASHELSASMRRALIQIADMREKMERLAEAKRERKAAEQKPTKPSAS
jgi:hypothetical protein